MFNFESAENLTNKQGLQLNDIKVLAGNKIRLGEEGLARLGAGRILILKDRDGSIAIGTVPTHLEDNTENKEGRPLNSKREFSQQVVAHNLGGAHSELNFDEEFIHPVTNRVWFLLKEVVNGAEERARIQELKLAQDAEDALKEEVEEELEEEASFGEVEEVEGGFGLDGSLNPHEMLED